MSRSNCLLAVPGVYFTQIALHVTAVLPSRLPLPSYKLFNSRKIYQRVRTAKSEWSRRDINVFFFFFSYRTISVCKFEIEGEDRLLGESPGRLWDFRFNLLIEHAVVTCQEEEETVCHERFQLLLQRGFQFQSINVRESLSGTPRNETPREFARLKNNEDYRRLRQFRIFASDFHLNGLKRNFPNVRRDTSRGTFARLTVSRGLLFFVRAVVRSRGGERHVHWSRATLMVCVAM